MAILATYRASGLSWDHGKRFVALAVSLLMAVSLAPATIRSPAPEQMVTVIVETSRTPSSIGSAIDRLGGTVTGELGVIDAAVARIPASAVATLRSVSGVRDVTLDVPITLHATENAFGAGWEIREKGDTRLRGRMDTVAAKVLEADRFWDAGYTGAGVGVAVIDTGVAPVDGLHGVGKILNGPDLSFDSQVPGMQYVDAFGHGTHLAGIIAGRRANVTDLAAVDGKSGQFVGIAPDAHVVNVKVGAADGAVDVSQVIAAIDWVVQHRNDPGANIRVLNLSFGTDGSQDPVVDPLSHAVEAAWRHGIVVVVSAGNDGNASPLRNPATNPYVIAVGATDTNGTRETRDDVFQPFSNCGTTQRSPDVVAPGKSIVSLAVPGSYADVHYPDARVDGDLFKGTGTSQAAAVVSGAAALVIDQRPDLTPDQVKHVLTSTALGHHKTADCQGAGLIDLAGAFAAATPRAVQGHAPSTGLGSLEAARGTDHLEHDSVVLAGEQDIFGEAWNPTVWAPLSASAAAWDGGTWNGSSWSGSSWSGSSWSGSSWSGSSWSGSSWSGSSWSGAVWNGSSWSGSSWSGSSWSGSSWSGGNWAGADPR